MFEVPEAKRVRREDLEASDDVSQSSLDDTNNAALRASLQAQLEKSLGLELGDVRSSTDKVRNDVSTSQTSRALDNKENEAGEFEFRLFSTAGSAPTVVLDVDEEAAGEGDIVVKRPPSYYFAIDLPDRLRQEYEVASVSGEDVLARSRCRSWGLELPWKVTTITTVAKANPDSGSTAESSANRKADKRKRPGKKTRIALRKRERAARERHDLMVKQEMDKAEHLKIKKTKLNRAKKMRRRAKDKEKKLAAVTAVARSEVESSGSE
ncbi:hypothetical protein CP533_1134 [Ophiocordyceps camponoti-saundersi (nom. inval.)]|nr:hypothetical protein CP533_1134 [Ophiocordyceps camponoti-saundersi (nom. inval.)]